MVRESKIDWFTILLFLALIIMGWLNLYSLDMYSDKRVLATHTWHGRELIFIGASLAMGLFILLLDTKFLEFLSYILYGLSILLLIAVLFVEASRNTTGWFEIAGFSIQPAEFTKVTTLMALAKFMSRYNYSMSRPMDGLISAGIIMLPALLVLMQNDTGSALVFGSFVLVFYREGMHPLFLVGIFITAVVGVLTIIYGTSLSWKFIMSIGVFVFAAFSFFVLARRRFLEFHLLGFFFLIGVVWATNLLVKPHHTARFRVLVTAEEDMKEKQLEKDYYNLRESLKAIGLGGMWGQGFGEATHCRGKFVPEVHTDYIFCMVAEEHGFMGAALLVLLLFVLVVRIIYMAEYSKTRYARVFGYGAAAVMFMHIFVNVGMTIGLIPTWGIPLMFFSYGGSSMISFTFMLAVILNHFSYRTNIL